MSEPGAKAPASAWYALAILVLTTLFAFVDRQILTLVAPSLQASLGFSDFQLGALQGLGLAIFASVASYPFGWLADRFGRRLILGIGAGLWSLATAACAFQTSFAGLFVATIGIAVGEAGLGPVIFAMIPDLFPERQRTTANFIYFAAALLGAGIGVAFGGLTLGWIATIRPTLPAMLAGFEPWRLALLAVAAPGPLFVALILSIRGGRPRSAAIGTDGDPPGASDFLAFARAHWRTLGCILGAIGGYAMPLASAFVWLPIAMPRIFGSTPAEVGIAMGISMGVAVVAGLALAPIGSRLIGGAPETRSIRLARLLMIVATLPTLLFLVPAAPWLIYAAAAGQLALATATAALMPEVLQRLSPPALRSRILALLGIASGLAQGLAPLLVGAVSGLIRGPRGLLTAIVVTGMPGWLIGIALISIAGPRFLATARAVAGITPPR